MSTGDLSNAVALFARSLMSTDVVERFSEARQRFETDAELTQSREAFKRAAKGFQEMQAAGTLTEEDINQIRTLQSNLNLHPRTVELLHAQQEMTELLRECNQQIFEVLGLDFSALAAPKACC